MKMQLPLLLQALLWLRLRKQLLPLSGVKGRCHSADCEWCTATASFCSGP